MNIRSLAGKNPFAGGAGYNASKFGLNGFTEAMMLDHRYDGVRCFEHHARQRRDKVWGRLRRRRSDWKIAPEDTRVWLFRC